MLLDDVLSFRETLHSADMDVGLDKLELLPIAHGNRRQYEQFIHEAGQIDWMKKAIMNKLKHLGSFILRCILD